MPQSPLPLFNPHMQPDLYPKAGRSTQTDLLQDLLDEVIGFHAIPSYYIVRESQDQVDQLWGEDPVKSFERSFLVPLYLQTFEGFQGDSEYISKLGYEIRDSLSLVISRRIFDQQIPTNLATRPREGDLIFIPLFNNLFEIKFVEQDFNWNQLGRDTFRRYVFELKVEAFRYSHEKIDTGVDEIDQVRVENTLSIVLNLGSGSGAFIPGENVWQQSSNASAEVLSWNAPAKELTIYPAKGAFAVGANVLGNTSGALWSLSAYDDGDISHVTDEHSDTTVIRTEADAVLDTTETNLFGVPS